MHFVEFLNPSCFVWIQLNKSANQSKTIVIRLYHSKFTVSTTYPNSTRGLNWKAVTTYRSRGCARGSMINARTRLSAQPPRNCSILSSLTGTIILYGIFFLINSTTFPTVNEPSLNEYVFPSITSVKHGSVCMLVFRTRLFSWPAFTVAKMIPSGSRVSLIFLNSPATFMHEKHQSA